MLRTYQEIRARVNELARESILKELPEEYRARFLTEYEAVAGGAPERLQDVLHLWWMRTIKS
ncbi:hypothetical protein [Acrocarpospora catenulata]|uniref:hypothetical protein n=1 Tax=Acrocarpospora catenulata TaxID=2836182 RepID=UPI001BD9797C|nr:hypothetical protein [Acrocarpospora catenulata]